MGVHRICPGQHLAEPFLFLCIAMTLATFNITKALDEHGNVIEPEIKWMSGTIRYEIPLVPFQTHARVFLTGIFAFFFF